MIKKEDRLIWMGFGVLFIYNLFLIPNLFGIKFITTIYEFYSKNMGTLTLLEFMMIAGLFGNLVVNYEKHKKDSNKLVLILTALMAFCFFLKIVFFFLGGFEDLEPTY